MEKVIAEGFEEQVGLKVESVECPESISDEVGATFVCALRLPNFETELQIGVTVGENQAVSWSLDGFLSSRGLALDFLEKEGRSEAYTVEGCHPPLALDEDGVTVRCTLRGTSGEVEELTLEATSCQDAGCVWAP